MTVGTAPGAWVSRPGSRVPPPVPCAYPGGVTPWGPLAGWGDRAAAALLDLLLALPGLLVVYLPGWWLLAAAPEPGSTAAGAVVVPLGVVAMWAPYLWSRVVVAGRTGQSWGRRVAGIRLVVERTGRPAGAPACLWREVVHGLDGVLCLGYLWAAVDPKRRTVADRAAGTLVVRG